ncbi:MAG: hypothetical protein ACI4GY_04090, partial [Acutalibacteraceae bacterium]
MTFNTPFVLDNSNRKVSADFQINEENGLFSISFSMNHTEKMKEAVLFCGEHGFSPDAPFYGDGYQKLSQYKGTVESFDSFTGYTDKSHYKMPQTEGFETVY